MNNSFAQARGVSAGPLSTRGGISLLEVLIAVFVLTVGLLGIIMLIPLGGLEVARAAKADRSAACGRASLKDLKQRGFLDPNTWRHPDGTDVVQIDSSTSIRVLKNIDSYAIDPLFLAKNEGATGTDIKNFPYGVVSPYYPDQTMRRVTVACFAQSGLSLSERTGLFERVFGWHDDLAFDISADPDIRPRQLYTLADSTYSADPTSSNKALRAETDGNYTWLATVSPALAPRDGMADAGAGQFAAFDLRKRRRYTVSIVVFHQRNFLLPASGEVPAERAVKAQLFGSGWSGGDLKLFVDDAADADYLNVKRNEWLMLCGKRTLTHTTTPTSEEINVFRWYRIVAVEDRNTSTPEERFVTVAGPDWNMNWCLNTSTNEVQAVLFDGITGVYTETIELD